MSLGPNNPQSSVRLSCTVTVSGLFQWSWQHNGNSLLSSDRYQILTGDATRSSILVINKLSYTDEGTYSCAVNHDSQTASHVRNVELQLQSKHFITDTLYMHYKLYPAATIEIEQDSITLETGQNGTLGCEMYGYLRGKIEWLKNGQQVQSGEKYSITNKTGSREGQDGGKNSVNSVVSQLIIQQVEEGDEGIYTCRVAELQDYVNMNITPAIGIQKKLLTIVLTCLFHAGRPTIAPSFVLTIYLSLVSITLPVITSVMITGLIALTCCRKRKKKQRNNHK